MDYINRTATMKWWDPHIKKLKYCSSAKFDKHNNKFCKGLLSGSTLMNVTNIHTLLTLIISLRPPLHKI